MKTLIALGKTNVVTAEGWDAMRWLEQAIVGAPKNLLESALAETGRAVKGYFAYDGTILTDLNYEQHENLSGLGHGYIALANALGKDGVTELNKLQEK